MAPVPLEGLQTLVTSAAAQGGMGGPQEGNRGGMISLAKLIDYLIQRTYHELTVLAELLPRKTDMERKIEIYNFATRTRQLFVSANALVKWANSKDDKLIVGKGLLDPYAAMLTVGEACMTSSRGLYAASRRDQSLFCYCCVRNIVCISAFFGIV